MVKSKSKKTKLTRESLLQSPEFWIENIKTELFNMVQEYMDENNLKRKELAAELGFTKGYISQVLNGDSDHRISKLVALATSLGKAPYFYLKDIEKVLQADADEKGIYIDFEELEAKAKRCDLIDTLNYTKPNLNEEKINRPWMSAFPSAVHEFDFSIKEVAVQDFEELEKDLQPNFTHEA